MARTRWAPGAPALAGAARVVAAVALQGRSADAAFVGQEVGAERSAVRAIALGTLRWYLRLAPALRPLLSRPEGLPPAVWALLVTAAHQIEYSRNAPQASVHAAVDATRLLDFPRVSGVVNAVLRRFVAERAQLLASSDRSLAARTAHPEWLTARLAAAWPAHSAAILAANNAHPPMTLRVDLSRTSVQDYIRELEASRIGASAVQWLDTAVILERPRAVAELPGFAEGRVSVQDAGAQLAARLLAPQPGMRVLDACAAPGGKTGQLLEMLGEAAEVTALDIDPARLQLVAANLARLKRRANLVAADAREPESFWDGRPYERILIDAPCSSTGVIRRHPDIKLLRRSGDIAPFTRTQQSILQSALTLLAPGGRLLYATCSVLPEENEALIEAFLERCPQLRPTARPEAQMLAPGALECGVGVQLLPGAEAATDGFYYACLEKTTAAAGDPRV